MAFAELNVDNGADDLDDFSCICAHFRSLLTVERLRAADNVDQFAGNGSLPRFIV
jgi:hypothetical protein